MFKVLEMYNPLELTKKIEKHVCKNSYRKYYRFRAARFYGGIASADCVGCNLRCYFCWSNDLAREGKIGKFYSGSQVAEKLVRIATKHNFKLVRITGNEPTLCREHLISVLENIPENLLFVLETNGILLGNDESYVASLVKFRDNLYVRVSLKGCTPEEFSKLTGAESDAYELQVRALEYCTKYKIPCRAAILYDLVNKQNLTSLQKKLLEIHPTLSDLEFEYLILYPHVKKRLRKAGLI